MSPIASQRRNRKLHITPDTTPPQQSGLPLSTLHPPHCKKSGIPTSPHCRESGMTPCSSIPSPEAGPPTLLPSHHLQPPAPAQPQRGHRHHQHLQVCGTGTTSLAPHTCTPAAMGLSQEGHASKPEAQGRVECPSGLHGDSRAAQEQCVPHLRPPPCVPAGSGAPRARLGAPSPTAAPGTGSCDSDFPARSHATGPR